MTAVINSFFHSKNSSSWRRAQALANCLLPTLSAGEGARRADEGRVTKTLRDGFRYLSRLKDMAKPIPRILSNARNLRHSETAAEIRLWDKLRGRRLCGSRFVRQCPVGRFIADFACRERRLIVEVDGVTHGAAADVTYDLARTAILEAQGWRIVLVTNEDVYAELSAVCDHIVWTLEHMPLIRPSATFSRR
jgi:very-short-patch-repair endonuclease